MRKMCVGLALIIYVILCLYVGFSKGEELPCPVRIPTPMFSTDDCDCEGCCCTICKCEAMPYETALKKARDENKPIVIFLNNRPHPVDGAVVTRVKNYEGAEFNVGVIVGTPLSWEGHKGNQHRELIQLYGPRSPSHILGFIRDHKARIATKRLPAFLGEVNCGPIG